MLFGVVIGYEPGSARTSFLSTSTEWSSVVRSVTLVLSVEMVDHLDLVAATVIETLERLRPLATECLVGALGLWPG